MIQTSSNLRRAPAAAATLLAALLASVALPAYAQEAPQSGAPASEEDPYADETVEELVVVGTRERPLPGAVVGDIQPEVQLR
ncbi:MAG: hypothetical protein JHD15_17725, partial [Phenylobacterium sp.]|uniref:hypothetical protein n=1 Tax=Phenylobacterium sp. TaxID=1871053 RepID=UPI001A1DBAF6